MTSCCHPHQMPWSGATGAIARCKRVSTGCGRKSRSVRVLRWICGVKLKPKAVNKPLPYFIVHELDKPGSSATVSKVIAFGYRESKVSVIAEADGMHHIEINDKPTISIGEIKQIYTSGRDPILLPFPC